MRHGTLLKRIYNNYSPGLFSSSYVQAKLAEVSYFVQYIICCNYWYLCHYCHCRLVQLHFFLSSLGWDIRSLPHINNQVSVLIVASARGAVGRQTTGSQKTMILTILSVE